MLARLVLPVFVLNAKTLGFDPLAVQQGERQFFCPSEPTLVGADLFVPDSSSWCVPPFVRRLKIPYPSVVTSKHRWYGNTNTLHTGVGGEGGRGGGSG